MIDPKTREAYTVTIGIECHVQLKTKTKLFAAVDNDARDAEPNTLVSHICFGLPGALPVLNREAVRLAARAAFALGTKPALFSKFDRKHYFYPDLPKGYQISQYDEPIITGGSIDVPMVDEATKERRIMCIGITRAHIEEDAGKSTHPAGTDYSLVDLNRAGTPLLEIISEPDMHSAAVAKAYARELFLRMKYADVSDCDLYLGQMRFDVNVSVSKDPLKLGTRTETKNLNSFRSIEKAIEYEVDRQIELLEKGEAIVQETRGWDDAKLRTFTQRTKEEAHDYRYMPDPDLPPVVLDEAYVQEIADSMPVLPDAVRARLQSIDIDEKVVEDVLDREPKDVLCVLEILDTSGAAAARRAVFWLLETGWVDTRRDSLLSAMIDAREVSTSAAKAIREAMAGSDEMPRDAAQRLGLLQVSDEGEIAKIVEKVLSENAKAAEDVKNGEMKAIGFLVGQVMKASMGKANPGLAQQLIKKQLGL
ncbi:MAG TPA: Asp-tRNA(Asn)/Glu-tRNA(Gln) amidotransferase subunit GatB [Candidatus Saccharimonadales bacterium]|nr:Asp-tRNA(Asn)/Glu-tRNA(Gln) amidotransferase subunit GatB [Candidatus Saccharimonadales bacterium]